MSLYRTAEQEKTASTARERYAFVIAGRTHADAKGIKTIMRQIEESFGDWPNERPVNFRDVVQYLAITECLTDAGSESGVRARVSEVVAKLIPANL